MTDTTRWTVLNQSLEALTQVTDDLTAADLSSPTPCTQWTVAQVLQHAALDQLAWANAVTAGAVDGPRSNPFEPTGTPASDVSRQVRAAVDSAVAAWATLDASGDLITPLPQGAMDADQAAAACALDAAIHAWDVQIALGRPHPLTPELAEALTPAAHAIVEPLRQWGAFAPVVPSDPHRASSDPVGDLLRYLGRDPHAAR